MLFERMLEIIKRKSSIPFNDESFDEIEKAYDLAIKILENSRWIPVSERLPKKYDDVLATDGCDMFVAWVGAWDMWNSSNSCIDNNTPIVAWMPLPEPYTKEETT